MSFTVPIHPVPFVDSYQGPLEPLDITDNSPLSLYVLCAKYIVKNISKISINQHLPSEICDNLIELFRIYRSKKVCNKFLSALSTKHCSVVSANLSNLDITDEELTDFIDAQGKTLRSLNLSKCSRLSSNVLLQVNRTLLKVHDVEKLCRLVTVYEIPADHPCQIPRSLVRQNYPFVIRKFYHKGKILTEINKNYKTACPESYLQNSYMLRKECPQYSQPTIDENVFINSLQTTFEHSCSRIPKTNYELNREMGLFCDPYFAKEFLFDMEATAYACYDRLIDDHRTYHLNEIQYPLISASQIIRSKNNSQFPNENLEPNQCPYCYGSGINREKIMILPKGIYHSMHLFSKYYGRYFSYDDKFLSKSSVCPSKFVNDNNNKQSSIIDMNVETDISAPEDDDESYFDNSFPYSVFNLKSRHVPLFNDLSYPFGSMCRRSLLSSCDQYFPRIHTSSQLSGNAFPTLLSRNNAVDGLNSEEFPPLQPTRVDSIGDSTLSSQSMTSAAATSSSCPILSSCAEAAFYDFETNNLPGESLAALMEESTSNSNSHKFPKFLKKFRPHSHNTFENDHNENNSECSKSSTVNTIDINQNVKDESSPRNFSPTSSMSFVLSEDDSRDSLDVNVFEVNTHEITCPLHPKNCPPEYDYFDYLSLVYNTETTTSEDVASELYYSEDMLRFEMYPYHVYRIETPGYPYVRLVEVVTWSPSSLESLTVGPGLMPQNLEEMRPELRQSIILNRDFNHLKRIAIHEWPVDMQEKFFAGSKYLDRITHLDLSQCQSIDDGRSLIQMSNLETLILYNVKEIYRVIDSICNIKSLKVLDISNSGDQTTATRDPKMPTIPIRTLISSLPKLVSLDISGSNIAVGIVTGLAERENNPLEFLGIFNTNVEPSSRHHIPAIKIAGENFEDLVLNSCEAYMNRPEMLKKCLNELFHIFRYEDGHHDLERAVKILVCSLGRHPNDKMIQMAASATLFYVIKSDEAKPILGRRIKELIVTRLLDAMQTFRYDQTMLRNGCLNLIHFQIPADVISEYTRLADILLYIVGMDDDDFVQRLGIYLLNLLACQVEGEQKTIVGNLGAIEKMLNLIESRYNRNLCDEVMETAWSTMWNVTDETPINCERFLNHNGMEFFVTCMEKFPDHPELLRNMMGLLGNVSECAHLRYRLMKDDYIFRFVQLLDSQSDGIEVSYNSAGILAHIASDGAEIWNRHLPTCNRDEMLARMECAISRWEINSKRNINYRSFEPILRLLRVLSISWQAQYWAVWALANLTRVHSNKYCTLLEKDGGVEVLRSFIVSPRPDNFSLPVSVKCLAVVTLFQYYLYNTFGNVKILEKSNEISCFELIKSPIIIGDFLRKFGFEHLALELDIDCDMNACKDIVMTDLCNMLMNRSSNIDETALRNLNNNDDELLL